MKRASLITLCLIGAFSAIQTAWAVDYPLPPEGSRLIGQNQTYTVQPGDKNLQAIARHFDTAAMLILEANDTIAPVPQPGTVVTIPSQMLLPDAPRDGIVVNLAELRLYYYPPGSRPRAFARARWLKGLICLRWSPPGRITHWGAMRCVWALETANTSFTAPARLTASVCGLARAVCA